MYAVYTLHFHCAHFTYGIHRIQCRQCRHCAHFMECVHCMHCGHYTRRLLYTCQQLFYRDSIPPTPLIAIGANLKCSINPKLGRASCSILGLSFWLYMAMGVLAAIIFHVGLQLAFLLRFESSNKTRKKPTQPCGGSLSRSLVATRWVKKTLNGCIQYAHCIQRIRCIQCSHCMQRIWFIHCIQRIQHTTLTLYTL